MPTSTRLAMQNTLIPLLEITPITRQMRLAIQSLAHIRNLTHPTDFSAIEILHRQSPALFEQFPRYSIDIDIQIVPQELANLGVLMVTLECVCSFGIRGIDVDVCGAVTVSRPARLRAARNHVCVLVEGSCGILDEIVDFVIVEIVDTQTGGDGIADKVGGLIGRGFGCEERVVGESEMFGRVGGVGEGRWVPEIFGV